MLGAQLDAAAADYAHDGFCVSPVLLPTDLLDAACRGVLSVIAGEYETGIEPYARNWVPSERPGEVVTIAEPHRCNRAIRAAVGQPVLGEWVAGMTGSWAVEIVAVDLFYKAPDTVGRAHVGWHQDAPFLEGEDEVLTAWLALSEVTNDSAPLLYVRGSHRAGVRTERGNLFAPDIDTDRLRSLIPGGKPDVVPAMVPRGAFSLHHRLTVHASGANTAPTPRISLAVRLRAGRFTAPGRPLLPGHKTIRIYGPGATRA